MKNEEITVVYRWTAMPGKSEELKNIYRDVEKQMKETEPNALKVECYFDESSGTLQIAVPGSFLFCGEVSAELKQAAIGMGLDATFAPRVFGFER
jgi:hypothetical protein